MRKVVGCDALYVVANAFDERQARYTVADRYLSEIGCDKTLSHRNLVKATLIEIVALERRD